MPQAPETAQNPSPSSHKHMDDLSSQKYSIAPRITPEMQAAAFMASMTQFVSMLTNIVSTAPTPEHAATSAMAGRLLKRFIGQDKAIVRFNGGKRHDT